MTLPIHSDFKGLAWAFQGVPFADSAVPPQAGSFHGLNTAFRGSPFAGTTSVNGHLVVGGWFDFSVVATTGPVSFKPPRIRTITPVLKTLDIPYQGGPFVEGFTDSESSFYGLDVTWEGGPFVVTSVTLSNLSVLADKGIVTVQGQVLSVGKGIPHTMGIVYAQGYSAGVRQASGAMIPIPGRLDVSGGFAGFTAAVVSASAGVLTGAEIAGLLGIGFVVSPPAVISVLGGLDVATCGFQVAAMGLRIYECWISGAGNISQPFPMSSMQARKRTGEPSYATVTLPGIRNLEGVLLQIDSGSFSVVMCLVNHGKIVQRETLFVAPIETVDVMGSSTDQSILLSGYWAEAAKTNPQYLAMTGVIYQANYAGVRTLRSADVDLYLQPGDIVMFDGESLLAESISYTISTVFGASMEVRGVRV